MLAAAQTIRGRRSRRHVTSSERRKRFGLLLVAIIAVFCIQGVADTGRWQQLLVSILLGITLLLALQVAEARPRVVRAMASVATFLVLVSLVGAISGDTHGTAARVANLLLIAFAPPAIIIGILRTLRVRKQVTIEAVFGVLCLYLLLGMFFAGIYGAIGRIDGTFFAQGGAATTSQCLYFSFATLTTVGYGDLTAKGDLGHTLAVSEALLGQLYLVTVVAVMVANLGRARPRDAAKQARLEGD